MTLAQLGHHIGLHVEVNLHGKTVGGMLFDDEHRVTGTIVGAGALGDSLTIALNAQIGGGEDHGVLTRASRGQDAVSIDDAARIRVLHTPAASVDAAIRAPVSAGKMKDAIRPYRELNGATLDEARAHIAGRWRSGRCAPVTGRRHGRPAPTGAPTSSAATPSHPRGHVLLWSVNASDPGRASGDRRRDP